MQQMNKNIENFIESLLFASGRPLRLSEIRSILENEGIKVDLAEIKVGSVSYTHLTLPTTMWV